MRGEDVSNMFPTTACIAALAVFQVAVAMLRRPSAERWLARRKVWKVVGSTNAVAMTLFTWHMTALVAVLVIPLAWRASQLIARLVHPAAGEAILDLCAGIGGKASHLAELTENRGRIIAVELLTSKIKKLHGLAARLGISVISTVAADATHPLVEVPPGSCDRVLLDVPCSGLGTLRRCPEIKWRLAPGRLARHAALQKRLLARAGDYVKPGGRLVYSTCSIMAEENEDVVRAFLEQRREFHRDRDLPATNEDRPCCWPDPAEPVNRPAHPP